MHRKKALYHLLIGEGFGKSSVIFPPKSEHSTLHSKRNDYFRHSELGQKTQVSCFPIKEVTKVDYPNSKQEVM